MTGAFQLSLATAADELNRSLEEVEAAIRGPLAQFVTYDAEYREIFLPAEGRIQVCARLSDGDKRRIRARRELRALNSPIIRQLLIDKYGEAWNLCDEEGASEGASEGGSEGASEAIAVPVQYQEQGNNSAVPRPSSRVNGAVLNIDNERQRRADRRGADGGSTPDSDGPEPYPSFNAEADAAAQAIGGLDNPAWRKWIRGGGEENLRLAIGLRLLIDAEETGWDPGEVIRSPTVFDRSTPGLVGQAESAYYRSRDRGTESGGSPSLVNTQGVGMGPDQAVDSIISGM